MQRELEQRRNASDLSWRDVNYAQLSALLAASGLPPAPPCSACQLYGWDTERQVFHKAGISENDPVPETRLLVRKLSRP